MVAFVRVVSTLLWWLARLVFVLLHLFTVGTIYHERGIIGGALGLFLPFAAEVYALFMVAGIRGTWDNPYTHAVTFWFALVAVYWVWRIVGGQIVLRSIPRE